MTKHQLQLSGKLIHTFYIHKKKLEVKTAEEFAFYIRKKVLCILQKKFAYFVC